MADKQSLVLQEVPISASYNDPQPIKLKCLGRRLQRCRGRYPATRRGVIFLAKKIIMKKFLSSIFLVGALLACIAQATPRVDFKRAQLSSKGRVAYDRLRSACIFRVGGVGWGGETSEEELALYQLLEERKAVEALRSLVIGGSYEGGLYGLLGLRLGSKKEFNRAVEIYNARKELPEWQTTSSFACFRATGDTVTTQSGCIISMESREEVVTGLRSGRYERLLTGKVRISASFCRLPLQLCA